MGVRYIDHRVLQDDKSSVDDVRRYLEHVANRGDSVKLSSLWDDAHEMWRPIIAKHWGMLNLGKNLLMIKIENGVVEAPEKKEREDEKRVVVVDDASELDVSDDPDALVEETEDDPRLEELRSLNLASARARKRVHGKK